MAPKVRVRLTVAIAILSMLPLAHANVGGWTTDAPAAVGRVAYGRGRSGDLQQLTERGWQSLGGTFS